MKTKFTTIHGFKTLSYEFFMLAVLWLLYKMIIFFRKFTSLTFWVFTSYLCNFQNILGYRRSLLSLKKAVFFLMVPTNKYCKTFWFAMWEEPSTKKS